MSDTKTTCIFPNKLSEMTSFKRKARRLKVIKSDLIVPSFYSAWVVHLRYNCSGFEYAPLNPSDYSRRLNVNILTETLGTQSWVVKWAVFRCQQIYVGGSTCANRFIKRYIRGPKMKAAILIMTSNSDLI